MEHRPELETGRCSPHGLKLSEADPEDASEIAPAAHRTSREKLVFVGPPVCMVWRDSFDLVRRSAVERKVSNSRAQFLEYAAIARFQFLFRHGKRSADPIDDREALLVEPFDDLVVLSRVWCERDPSWQDREQSVILRQL